MTAKDLLLYVTERAYNGDEMSLLCGVYARTWVPPDNLVRDPERDLTDDLAKRQPGVWYRTIWDILKHVADCKAMYMTEAFGEPPKPFPEAGEALESVLAYLDATQQHLVVCLERTSEDDLAKPVATSCHGETAANLFWVLAQHDVSHGAQIAVLRVAVER